MSKYFLIQKVFDIMKLQVNKKIVKKRKENFMGWTEGFFDFKEGTSPADMSYDIHEQLLENRGRMEPHQQKLLLMTDLSVFSSYDEAIDFLENNERCKRLWRRENIGVRYIHYPEVAPSKKENDLDKKIEVVISKKFDYKNNHSIKTFKSDFIGCPNCGSKLKRDLIKYESCVLCGTDLRSETTLKTLKKYDEKVEELRQKKEEIKKEQMMKGKGETRWLVYAQLYLG